MQPGHYDTVVPSYTDHTREEVGGVVMDTFHGKGLRVLQPRAVASAGHHGIHDRQTPAGPNLGVEVVVASFKGL